MDDERREYLQKHHQGIHADVEALASCVQEILSSFGVLADKAFEVYENIVAGDTLLAAYTAAIDVAEEALRKSNKAEDEVEKLTQASKRSESLAILRDHINYFRIDIAYKMHFSGWEALADKLHYERKKPSKPTHALLETTLRTNHLSMKVWNEVKEVADAGVKEFHKGNDSDAQDVMQLLNGKLLPDDLVHTKDSLEQMLQYVED